MLIKYAGEDFNNLISEGLVLVDFLRHGVVLVE